MARWFRWIVPFALCALAQPADAQTATQVVRFRVTAVSQMAVTGASYAISTNEANQKICASIDREMPAGVSLEVHLAAPAGATSAGSIPLSTDGADVVTGISAASATALPITYRLRAAPRASLAPTSRTVTLTIVAGA